VAVKSGAAGRALWPSIQTSVAVSLDCPGALHRGRVADLLSALLQRTT
jgi:hypothetical protein